MNYRSIALWLLFSCAACGEPVCGDGEVNRAEEECDDANAINGDGCDENCTISACGNGITANEEACDDANAINSDGCDLDCTLSEIVQVEAGGVTTCIVLDEGDARCWGTNEQGNLGQGNFTDIGDNEPASALAGSIDFGGAEIALVNAGGQHNCALGVLGEVFCWGNAGFGRLGYGNEDDIGGNETPGEVGQVDVGGTAVQLSLSFTHTCALLDTGTVRCWGRGESGALGYGNEDNVGDNETPAAIGDVPLARSAVEVSAGGQSTCARFDDGTVLCWGANNRGQLGLGNTENVGDDELPNDVAEFIFLGGSAVQLASGDEFSCALLDDGAVRCWGSGDNGALGYGNLNDIGDNEAPLIAGDVPLGGVAVQIVTGRNHVCALLDTGAVRCWGDGSLGQLGYGNTDDIGDDETPAAAGDVPLGGLAVQLAAGNNQTTCALLDTGALRCWGDGNGGKLGYGNEDSLGDDETPAEVGDVPVFVSFE